VRGAGAAGGGRLGRFLEGGALRAVGKYSFAIYVFHPLIILTTVRLLAPSSALPPYLAKPALVAWVLAASFGAAWLSYHLYEKHFLRLKRFFEYREPAGPGVPVPSPCAAHPHA